MSTNDARFVGSIPTLYEEHLVPLLFAPYAADLASRVADLAQGALLEVAAGTGAVTRVLAAKLPREVRIVATDLNEAMLAVSARAVAAPNVTRRQADAQRLPFADGEFDAVVCQFGMMFPSDKPAAYREARRVLKPGGRFLFSVWGRLEDNEASAIVARVVAARFPADPPTFYERVPFGFGDPDRLRREVAEAGFARVSVDTVDAMTTAPTAIAALGLVQGTPLRGEIEARGADLDEVTAKVTAALAERYSEETIENPMRALVVTAHTE